MLVGQVQNSYFGAEYFYRGNGAASKVDPTNATYGEMMLLVHDFLEQGTVEEGAFDFMKEPEDLNQRFNFLAEAREWKKAQRDSGEMVGYQRVLQACNAMCNFISEPAYVETADGPQRVKQMEGELTSGILALGGCENGYYYAQYAPNSTAENPIVEVRVASENGVGEKIYYVDINSVNPRNATELEMFALLAHHEKQGTMGDMKLYYQGKASDIFASQNIAEFMFEKRDWFKQLEAFSDLKISGILQELFQQIIKSPSENAEDVAEPLPDDDTVNLLLADSICCTYPSKEDGKIDDLYVISWDAQGIRCSKAGEPGLVWEIEFTDDSQYRKVKEYMERLQPEDDLGFVCLEEFWRDFLGGKRI